MNTALRPQGRVQGGVRKAGPHAWDAPREVERNVGSDANLPQLVRGHHDYAHSGCNDSESASQEAFSEQPSGCQGYATVCNTLWTQSRSESDSVQSLPRQVQARLHHARSGDLRHHARPRPRQRHERRLRQRRTVPLRAFDKIGRLELFCSALLCSALLCCAMPCAALRSFALRCAVLLWLFWPGEFSSAPTFRTKG